MRRILLKSLPALLVVLGCSTSGSDPEEPLGPPAVRLSDASVSNREEVDAARLYLEARDHIEMGDWQAAGETAGQVVDRFPASRVSGDALWLQVQAWGRVEAGALQGEALAGVERLIPLLPDADRRQAEARLLWARLMTEAGRPNEGIRVALDSRVTRVIEADREWFRGVLDARSRDELGALVAEGVSGSDLISTLLTVAARKDQLAGEAVRAVALAERAILLGASGADLELARQIVEGEPLAGETERRVMIAALLPQSGSPSMRRLAAEVEEGIRAAFQAAGLGDLVELTILDDGGDPGTAAALVQEAQRQGAIGIIGPLVEASLAQAAAARVGPVAMVSPTAFGVPAGLSNVYSLSGYDPGAAEALSDWSAAGSLGPVAIIHPSFGSSAEEAQAFAEAYRDRGGRVLRLLPYEPGTTFFETQIRAAIALRPSALILPIPANDVSALAPQVTFFGLDTLGIRIMGTGGWTDPVTMQDVSTRHLTGVVAATPVRPTAGDPGWERFRTAYETFYQRTLRESAVQALGYDATSLLLGPISAGARSTDAVIRALDQTDSFEGATGALSVSGGRIARSHDVICFNQRELLPALQGQIPVLQYRPYSRDPVTDSIPGGAGRMAGFLCPQVALPDTVINPR